jgi:hypothetical protein
MRQDSQASLIVGLAEDCRLVHDSEGTTFAIVPSGAHFETHKISSKGFRRWLSFKFYTEFGKSPGTQALQDAIATLEGKASFEGDEVSVHLRVGGNLDRIVIDLGNRDWSAVVIDRSGWKIPSNPGALFRRTKGLLPMPAPARGGSINELKKFLNLNEEHWRLVVGWLLGALRPVGPYPVLSVTGEQGSAKSTTCRLLRNLIDPNLAPLRSPPRNEQDLILSANNGWVVCLENLSFIPDWLSDSLCRLATGGGFSSRELYSDGDEVLFNAQRPIVLNGIEESAGRSDLLDRGLLVSLPAIPEHARKTEAELWRNFDRVAGRILGALFDATAQAIKTFKEVQLESLPRMADFAIWLAAAETSLGWEPGGFDQAYRRNRLGADEAAIESSLIATRVRDFFEDYEGDWVGTASQLLEALNRGFDPEERRNRERSKDWPTKPHVLSGKLRRLAPNLRRLGIEIRSGTNWERKLCIRRLPESSAGSAGSAGSAPDSIATSAPNAVLHTQSNGDSAPANATSAPNAPLHTQSKSPGCPDCGGPLVETPTADGWLNSDCRDCGHVAKPRKQSPDDTRKPNPSVQYKFSPDGSYTIETLSNSRPNH